MSDWLAQAAAGRPDAFALRHGESGLDYAALDARANVLASALQARGVVAGDRVVFDPAPGIEVVALLHAVWRIGACAVPLNSRLAARERAEQLERLAPYRAVDPGDLLMSESSPPTPPVLDLSTELEDAMPALVLFTSGTTGRPKAAVITHGNLDASARASTERLGTSAQDRWLLCLPLFHIGGLSILVRAAIDLAGVVLHERFDVEAVSDAIDAGEVSRVSLVPTTLKRLLDHRQDRPAPAALRTVLLGGSAASAGLLARARSAGFPAIASYGMTETTSQVVTARLDDPADGRVGAPLPGSRVRLRTTDGKEPPCGESGEIQVAGPTVFPSYFDDPGATTAAFDGVWFRTGDIGRFESDGGLRVLDRRSDLVISGGENVYPAEVEAALLEHPAVAEVAV